MPQITLQSISVSYDTDADDDMSSKLFEMLMDQWRRHKENTRPERDPQEGEGERERPW